jgi:transcription elongation factor GreB
VNLKAFVPSLVYNFRITFMSRAFVKEPDGDQAETNLPERPQSEHPNYITPAGLVRLRATIAALRTQVRALEEKGDDLSARSELQAKRSDLRYLEKREQCAIPVDAVSGSGDEIRFGATVELADMEDRRYRFTIVGEDEIDVENGSISWVSPLGAELLKAHVGDEIVWNRPSGSLQLEILSVRYDIPTNQTG